MVFSYLLSGEFYLVTGYKLGEICAVKVGRGGIESPCDAIPEISENLKRENSKLLMFLHSRRKKLDLAVTKFLGNSSDKMLKLVIMSSLI
ncbi:hypothetical protein A0J61_06347 [Choanephora cucurbitarum]|uniref:Uncharacterized protein n=1 Tax=Choanephora cucurbitarum TaxID=101091 RepID=A0A1C7NE15_9FUNG|nr:hypothetical protein A0J61_06347 [Choanephora cucurbitarum]